jgi:hypothetical protein
MADAVGIRTGEYAIDLLGQSKSNQRKDKNASLFGRAKGLKLSIKNAVEGKSQNLFLSYKK